MYNRGVSKKEGDLMSSNTHKNLPNCKNKKDTNLRSFLKSGERKGAHQGFDLILKKVAGAKK
jgi:hypothetical protein